MSQTVHDIGGEINKYFCSQENTICLLALILQIGIVKRKLGTRVISFMSSQLLLLQGKSGESGTGSVLLSPGYWDWVILKQDWERNLFQEQNEKTQTPQGPRRITKPGSWLPALDFLQPFPHHELSVTSCPRGWRTVMDSITSRIQLSSAKVLLNTNNCSYFYSPLPCLNLFSAHSSSAQAPAPTLKVF